MNKVFLINLAIICSVFGIILLAYLLQTIDFYNQNYLSINGTILSIRYHPKITFITLQPDSLQVVSFKNVSFKKGRHVDLQGELKNYKGRLEFVVR